MKKDLIIALVAALIVAAVCYGLVAVRPPFQPVISHPFSATQSSAAAAAPEGNVVIRINGEPITEQEFSAAYQSMPPEAQQQFAGEQGRMAFAEQLVRMKLLEQEAKRLGLENDPKIAGQLAAQRMDLLADAAASKLTPQPSEAAIQKYYDENKGRLESVDVSHILIAYAGGGIPARGGAPAPPETEAMNKALKIYDELRKGADFATAAKQYSDDVASAQRGGELGPVGRGMLPPELEARVFEIPAGQISGPIPSPYGIHIFKVNSRGAAPLATIRAALVQRLRQKNMYDQVDALRQKASVVFDPKFFPTVKNIPNRKPS
ncbi:MAG TPA: peptidylprolyl isomerase [Thermoanaerobaculia bacterium]|nr:peptidylprolyl isomerase [Thermoanaerobaculia bacterium]